MENRTFVPNKLTLLTILMSSMVILMGAAAVAPALSLINDAFPEAGTQTVSLIVTLPALSVAITGFGMGYMADRFGKAKVLITSLIIFTIAGVSGFFLENLTLVLIGRFVLGVGITGISSTTTALLSEYWTGTDRAKVIGYQSAAIGVGTLVLESLGGILSDIGWHYPFLIYLIGVPIIITGILSIKEPVSEVGFKTETVNENETSNGGKVLICYAIVFLAMFLMFSLPTNFSYYMIEIGQSLSMCGILLGVMGICQSIFSILYSRSTRRLNEMKMYSISFIMMAIGLGLLYINNMAAIWISMILVGFSLGALMPTVIAQLSTLSTAKTSGRIMGGYSVALNLSTFVSGTVITMFYTVVGSFQTIYLVLGSVSVVLAVACILYYLITSSKTELPKKELVSNITIDSDISITSDEIQMYSSILVPTDGSESSNYAVCKAIDIAKKNRSEITALFVVDLDRYTGLVGSITASESVMGMGNKISKEALDFVTEQCKNSGIKVTAKTMVGHPAEVISNESENHDLVVCGSLGRSNIPRLLIGSVAEKVARLSKCPVLICRKNMSR